jgi:hypothetical protein
MLARDTLREVAPKVRVTSSASFTSSSCANASSQNLNDTLSFVTSSAFGHVAFTESAVVVSFASTDAFIVPNALQNRLLSLAGCCAQCGVSCD